LGRRSDGITGKVADSDKLDGQDSTALLGANQKAADSETLDGIDSAAFGSVAEGDNPTSAILTQSYQVLNTMKITPGSPSGYIKAEAVVQVRPSLSNTVPTQVVAQLYSPEEHDFLTRGPSVLTVEPSSGTDQLVVTGVIPVSAAGEHTIQVVAASTDINGPTTIFAGAPLANATYFPFGPAQ